MSVSNYSLELQRAKGFGSTVVDGASGKVEAKIHKIVDGVSGNIASKNFTHPQYCGCPQGVGFSRLDCGVLWMSKSNPQIDCGWKFCG